jgi:hypothetical protein
MPRNKHYDGEPVERYLDEPPRLRLPAGPADLGSAALEAAEVSETPTEQLTEVAEKTADE